MNQPNKKQIALRLNPNLINRIDTLRPFTNFESRTELIETACAVYLEFLEEGITNI